MGSFGRRKSGGRLMIAAIAVALCLGGLVAAVSCGGQAGTGTVVGAFPHYTVTPVIKSTDYTRPDICAGCHAAIYSQWSGAMMNNSFTDEFYRGMHKQAGDETGGATDTFCSTCHTPIGTFSGEVPPIDGPQVSEIARQGVQCDFCHTVSAATGVGNAAFKPDPGPVKRGPYTDSNSQFHRSAYSDLHTKSEFCGMCHDLNHPGNGLAIEATYTEWKNSTYATEGVQCQDCHMVPAPGVATLTQAANGGPVRSKVFTHQFVGGNATTLASADHRVWAADQLKGAAMLTVASKNVTSATEAVVEVNVKNDGAGHYLPTGITEVREMWLEVTLTDAGGRVLYSSGALDAAGEVDPQAKQYHTVFSDVNGDVTVKPWLATGILDDTRIPPRQSDTQKFTMSVPAGAARPFTFVATLHYRSSPPSLMRELTGGSSVDNPVTDMATVRETL